MRETWSNKSPQTSPKPNNEGAAYKLTCCDGPYIQQDELRRLKLGKEVFTCVPLGRTIAPKEGEKQEPSVVMADMFNTEQSLYLEDSFESQFDDSFSSGVQPKMANYNFQTISRRIDQGMSYISNEMTFQSSHPNRTAFDNFGSQGGERILQGLGYYEFGSAVTNSPSYGENGVCGGFSDDLDLAPGMENGTRSPPKDTVFDACPTQGSDNGGRHARATIEPINKVRRVRANDRERRRMKSLNRALESLKKCIPVPQSKRRVTKLEVLRIACSYIRSLSESLSDESASTSCPFRKRSGKDTVVNGFSVAQRLEILSGSGATRI